MGIGFRMASRDYVDIVLTSRSHGSMSLEGMDVYMIVGSRNKRPSSHIIWVVL